MSISEESKKKPKKVVTKKTASKKRPSKEAKEFVAVKEALEIEKDKYLRLFAEFENFKKRTSKERIELFKTAGQDVMIALLPVVDDFDRAIKEADKSKNSPEFEGFRLISNKLVESLKSKGLEPVSVEIGETFDSEVHEAITQIPSGDDQKGKIIDVIEKGYKLGDKILRYPKVVVGQ
jgi:molecular chaperone GrpE